MEIEDFIKEELGEDGGFKRVLKGFEYRPQQQRMAMEVFNALKDPHHLIVEAPTGVGKSFAYLLPSSLLSSITNKRILISTYTKLLQEQLVNKDIPILKQVVKKNLKVEVAYGQENYLCKRRLYTNLKMDLFDDEREIKMAEELIEWSKRNSGILLDYPEEIPPSLYNKICRDGDSCLFKKCGYYEECSYYRAKKRWQESDILVINHYLFFANLATENRLLPEFYGCIFDEAHQLEEAAAHYFGITLSNFGMKGLLSRLYNPKTNRGILSKVRMSRGERESLYSLVLRIREDSGTFFSSIDRWLGEKSKRRVREPDIAENILDSPLRELSSHLEKLSKEEPDEELSYEIKGLAKQVARRRREISLFLSVSDTNSVFWIEREGGRIVLRSAVVDVASFLKTSVFDSIPSVVLTSATLTTDRGFSFFASRVGLEKYKSLLLDSPFDYLHNTLVYIGKDLPFPTQNKFYEEAAKRLNRILSLSKGRALILFTSYKALEEVYKKFKNERYRVLSQGELSRPLLLKVFKEDITSVLFATQSFWQGVDVPGEALSCLAIMRLPFDVPDEPRIEAVIERIKKDGKDPFFSFQLPNAVLRLRQGFGRLIRTKRDRGVVCLLDSRITNKSYGTLFLSSLPECPITYELSELERFFSQTSTE